MSWPARHSTFHSGCESSRGLSPENHILKGASNIQYWNIQGYGSKGTRGCYRLHHSNCESRPRLRGLGSPEKVVLGAGGLVAVDWGFQEALMGSRATRASPILIFRGPLALSIMFLIVLLQPRMLSASNVEYDLR